MAGKQPSRPRPDPVEGGERWRLFVAVELPDGVQQGLGRLQSELKQRDLRGLRWVRPEGVHLTLKFLGETPVERLPAVQQALSGAVEGIASFGLALGEPGSFGDRRGPRVVWVGLRGETERLAGLQERIERALTAIGFAGEGRPFSPHLTLARVPPEAIVDSRERLAAALAAVEPPTAAMTVTAVSLMRSILLPGGAVYQRVAAFALE